MAGVDIMAVGREARVVLAGPALRDLCEWWDPTTPEENMAELELGDPGGRLDRRRDPLTTSCH